MSKVAPKTLGELLALPPEAFQAFTLEQLQELHTLAKTGTTKQASLKADQLEGAIKSKRKEMGESGTKAKPEPERVVNSAKVVKPAKNKAEKAEAEGKDSKPKPPVSPSTTKRTVRTRTASPSKPKPNEPKPKTKKEQKDIDKMSPEELKQYAKQLEKQTEKFPEEVESENKEYVYRRIEPENIEDLCKTLFENPFHVYAFMDELKDPILTQLLIPYASDKLIVFVDKNKEHESYMCLQGTNVGKIFTEKAFLYKEGKDTFVYPTAFYVKQLKSEE